MIYLPVVKYNIPSVLHVCHTSLIEAVKIYKHAFQLELGSPVFFRPKEDLLVFDFENSAFYTFYQNDRVYPRHESVKQVSFYTTSGLDAATTWSLWWCRCFSKLETLYVISANPPFVEAHQVDKWNMDKSDETQRLIRGEVRQSRGLVTMLAQLRRDPGWVPPRFICLTPEEFEARKR